LSANTTARQFEFSYSTTDYLQILDDRDIDCVFIATRHDSHARIAAESLKRGKAVFLEKPLAIDFDGLREVASAARQHGGVLLVGYNRRFAPIARQVKDWLKGRAGPMTIVYRVNAGRLPPDHWSLDPKIGGGRIIGEVCHFVDFIQYLTGELPARVVTVPVAQSAGTAADGASISLGMSNGSIASIIYASSGDASSGKERVEIFCDGKSIVIDDFKTAEMAGGRDRAKSGGRTQKKGHVEEISAFFDAVKEGGAPISLESMIATSLTTFAAVESARSGSWVPVDLTPFL
jgi:predicted dehydrogenase